MNTMDDAENTTPLYNLKTEDEYTAQPESDLGGETEREHQETEGPIEGPKSGVATNVEDAGPPDGGTTAWLVVLGAWCCSFCSPGWVNSVGAFQQYYEVGPLKDYPSSTISWIPSLQFFFLFALGPIVGIIFDNYGPRPLIIGGTLLHVFGLMMASLATTYYEFILSQGVCSAIALACISTWFSKKRGAVMGIMVTGSSVGGVVFPIMLTRMIPSIGYPWAMRSASFIIFGLQIIAILTVRPRIRVVPKKLPASRLAAPFMELPFIMLLLGIFVLTFGILIPINYLAVQGFEEAHMSEDMSQYLVSIFNATSFLGRLSAGYGADIIGKWNMFIVACTFSGIVEFAVWIPAQRSSIAIGFAVMFGFVSGAFIGLIGALPISVSPAPEIGYRLGVVLLAVAIPALAMGPVGGAILQSSADGWLGLKIFSGIMCLVGSAFILVSRLHYTKKEFLKVF
ncbi:major facilitator superfamily domain-containing protein [Xylariales sp. PMI_506]|nr:major facilitator superfamily domain-containing protein [Xylariales sp. PMI_506]